MIALLLLALTPHLASAKEFHVSVNGNDQDQGSASEPLRTISVAAQVAQPGDVITVHAGVYPSPCRDLIPKQRKSPDDSGAGHAGADPAQ